MKRLLLLISVMIFFVPASMPNGVMLAEGDITELYFYGTGSWTIELKLDFVNPTYDSVFCFFSSLDTAFLSFTPQTPGIYLLTPADFTSSFSINPDGDELTVVSYEEYQGSLHLVTQHQFVFGDYPGSSVNAPGIGQSLVGLPDSTTTGNLVVKDNSQSLGFETDPQRGTLRGYVYDSLNNPMPYQKLHLYGIQNRIVWTDENGYFEDNTVYGMNYEVFIYDQDYVKLISEIVCVEPDSITNVDIILPTDLMVTNNGRIIGGNQQGLIGSYAIFTHEFINGPIDTFQVDANGNFVAELVKGNYYVRYSCPGHIPQYTIPPMRFYADRELGIWMLEEGNVAEIDRGKISGNWENDQPYYIFGDLEIDYSDTLTIDPGSNIHFCGGFRLDVYGTLIARGNSIDSIRFIRSTALQSYWKGLNFSGPEAAGSDLAFCSITGAKYFSIFNGSPVIENNSFTWVIDININDSSAPIIRNNNILASINCNDYSQPILRHNLVKDYDGIWMSGNSLPTIEYNTFSHLFTVFRTYADSARPSIKGNIFYQSNPFFPYGPLKIFPINMDHNLFYEIITWVPWFGELVTVNANGDSCDINYNLFMDPLVVDPEAGDFRLLPGSPCIDAGDPASVFDPDSTIADMGAFYYDQLNTFVKKPWDIAELYKIKAVPNPNRGAFTVHIDSPENHHYDARIILYSIGGNSSDIYEIAVLGKGENKIQIKRSLSPGIYICTLEVGGKLMGSTKVVVMR